MLLRCAVSLHTLAFLACALNCAGATAIPFDVRVSVQTVGPQGFVAAASVHVMVCTCSDTLSCFGQCEGSFGDGITGSNGTFFSTGYGYHPPAPYVGFATIGAVSLRGFVVPGYGQSVYVTIDPVSEAAIELLDGHPYSTGQILALMGIVSHANAATDFSGLSLQDAIARARSVAAADPALQAALPTWTPVDTPTPGPTATPTPTHTRRPTGTPRPCTGDCGGDGSVEVDELITGVNIALGRRPFSDCSAAYAGRLPDVADLIAAVNNALHGCEPGVPLPDLVAENVQFASGPSCTGYDAPTYCLNVCVANVGDASALPFTVAVGDGVANATWRVNSLVAGDGDCGIVCDVAFEGSVRVDVQDAVIESREDNNQAPYQVATPTPPPRCPSPTPT